MANVTLRIANGHPLLDPRDVLLRAKIGNQLQTCPEGTTGDPVPAGKVFANTLSQSNSLAESLLVCEGVPD